MTDRFIKYTREHNLFSAKDKLVLAVSGGVDSIVLCELCKQCGYDFVIAHCNFQLREMESERDEAFVKELGTKYGVEVLTKKFETGQYATAKKLSIQEAARDLRYEWFETIITARKFMMNSRAEDTGRSIYLLTAHHADDNAETILMNFCRGTGLHGLTGIPVSSGHIRRPLLPFSKSQLVQFAAQHGLAFVEDSSNLSSKYTRNLFRNEIIPLVSTVYPMVKENLIDNVNRFREIEKLYDLSVGEIKKKLCRVKGNEVHIPVKQLMAFSNKALIYEIIKSYGFAEKQVEEVLKLADSDSGKFIIAPDHSFRIIKHRHWFIISPVQALKAGNIVIEEKTASVDFEGGNLTFESIVPQASIPATTQVAHLDMKDVQFPLLLRKWKAGDYFYPLGMKKKKKLSRFFIDQKLSKTEKENAWVIESNKKIIWVVGHRIDDRFKITSGTKSALSITRKERS